MTPRQMNVSPNRCVGPVSRRSFLEVGALSALGLGLSDFLQWKSIAEDSGRSLRDKAVIFIWLSGAFFHGARFSNYTGWLADPTHVKPSAQVVWPVFGQEILNGDVGAGFHGIQITSGLFHVWRAWGITNTTQLMALAIGALVMAGLMLNEIGRAHV